MKQSFGILLCLALLLTGCSSAEGEIVEPSVPDISEQMDTAAIFGIEFEAIGPVCGFIIEDDAVEIHPYYNSSEHIQLKKILLSDRLFWNTIKSSVQDSAVVVSGDNYDMITVDSGITYAYKQLDDNWALIAKSDTLPSSYVKAVMDRL
ncbi:MAG: hypothetical protein NC489_30200 [Ruminococcus flavefaciens]|nr:hypothetical protein [Ruminococcus flavefaciens]